MYVSRHLVQEIALLAKCNNQLNRALVNKLADAFPGSIHVSQVGLAEALDRKVWEYARTHSMVLVSKDADFSELGTLLGFPPKVIWIRRGNCSTKGIEQLLHENRDAIDRLAEDDDNNVLALF